MSSDVGGIRPGEAVIWSAPPKPHAHEALAAEQPKALPKQDLARPPPLLQLPEDQAFAVATINQRLASLAASRSDQPTATVDLKA